jgi:hypothetical protein
LTTGAETYHHWRPNVNMFISAIGGTIRFFPRTADANGFGPPVTCVVEGPLPPAGPQSINVNIV